MATTPKQITVLQNFDSDGEMIALDFTTYKLQTPYVFSYRTLRFLLMDLVNRLLLTPEEASQCYTEVCEITDLMEEWKNGESSREMMSHPEVYITSTLYRYTGDETEREYIPAELCN